MRILYFHQHFRVPSQGGGVRSYEFARRWVADGHEVEVIAADALEDLIPGDASTRPRPPGNVDGIEVQWLPVRYHQAMGSAARMRAFVSFIVRASVAGVRADRPDVILATSAPLTIAVPAAIAKLVHRRPLIFEARDLWPEVPIALGALSFGPMRIAAEWLEWVAYRVADHCVGLSPGIAAGMERRGASTPSIIPNSADRETFDVPLELRSAVRAERPWLGDRPLLVYTGTFGIVNNCTWLIELMSEIGRLDSSVRLLLVGFGSQEEEIRALADQHGLLGTSVFIESFRPKAEVAEIVASADLAFSTVADVPALWNNSANKVFDSFAAGTPIAINHEGWMADLLRSSGAGLVLPVGEPRTAAEQVVEFLADPVTRTAAERAASGLADGAFDRTRHAAAYLDLLLTVADRGSAPPVRFTGLE